MFSKQPKPVLFILFLALACVMTAVSPSSALGDESPDAINRVIIDCSDQTEELSSRVTEALNDPDVDAVWVVNTPSTDSSPVSTGSDESVSPCWDINFQFRNKKYTGAVRGGTVLRKAYGSPGTTLQITCTSTVSNSYTCSVTIPTSELSAYLGFTVTSSESIAVSGSAIVPYTHNSKKVASMTLTAYPLYDCYSYDVYSGSYYWSSGTAKHAIGYAFSKTYTYA